MSITAATGKPIV